MYSTDLLLKVPKTILLTGISGIDGKPISAIAWKALLSIMYFFPERDHCEITDHDPAHDVWILFQFGVQSQSLTPCPSHPLPSGRSCRAASCFWKTP